MVDRAEQLKRLRDSRPQRPNGARLVLLWIGLSALGAWAGAQLAVILFPDAGLGRNPTGHFAGHLIGFALAIGIPLALCQWLVLRFVAAYPRPVSKALLLTWIPITAAGVLAILLPLWWMDAEFLVLVPLGVWIPMLPGLTVLGIAQSLPLYQIAGISSKWAGPTVVGGALGAVVGLIAALMLPVAAFEPIWASCVAAGMAACQAHRLVIGLNSDREWYEPWIGF